MLKETPTPVRVMPERRHSRRPPLLLRFIGAILGGAFALVFVVLRAALRIVVLSLTSRWRYAAAPGWFLAAAALPIRDVELVWVGLSVALALVPKNRLRGISDRERWVIQRVTAGVAGWHLLAVDAPLWLSVPSLVAVVAAGAVPWWRGGRWVLFGYEEPHVLLWRELVAESGHAKPALQGSVLRSVDIDPATETTTGVVELAPGRSSSEVALLDEHVESLLRLPRGTVTLGSVPLWTPREARIVLARPGDETRMRFWDGPSLTADGRWTAGYTTTGDPVEARLWQPGGAVFGAAVAAQGAGKGVFMRTLLLEAALSPLVYVVVLDGKLGMGIPEAYDGADVYAGSEGPVRWRKVIDGVHAVYKARAARYGAARRGRWVPGKPDPLILFVIDELSQVVHAVGKPWVRKLVELGEGMRATGIGMWIDTQKGDGPSYGDTALRAHLLGNGFAWIGPAGDAIARQVAVQDYACDPGRLPPARGWAFLAGRVFGVPPTMMRGRYVPSVAEVEDDDAPHPFGIAEDWFREETRHPVLHEEDQAALENALTGSGGVAAVMSGPALSLTPPSTPSLGSEPRGRDAVLGVLRGADGPVPRGYIARKARLSPRYVSDVLAVLADDGLVERVTVTTDGRKVGQWKLS